ncbi:MAG: D-arabinose 5-phosphate isomerase [Gammaproteobacteria bacterium]|nr:MAG: D-arabinose 5-phosphate isomerase [Gammaproteobacteria bacterium]
MDPYLKSAHRVFEIERDEIQQLQQRLNASFSQACETLLHCKGRVVVTGMGKSGHIAHKIAATFASTGTPAFFVHPAEACHGDLGMIGHDDVLLAISNSGSAQEILTILPLIKRRNTPLISLTGSDTNKLASFADINLNIGVSQEACPLGLAPTSSTTSTLVMGDALAIALLEARGFTAEDFAMSHPAGALGRKLLLIVADIMRSGNDIPITPVDGSVRDALVEMSKKGMGMTSIIDQNKAMIGVYTDGDLRRGLDQGITLDTPIKQAMTKNFKTIQSNVLAAQAVQTMEANKVHGLIVVNDQTMPVGALNVHDLFRAGVM